MDINMALGNMGQDTNQVLSSITTHRHQHGFRRDHRSWTCLAFGGNMDHMHHDHGPQHGVPEQHELQISPWSPLSAQITCINVAPSSSMVHGHQHGFRKWHRWPTSTWPLVVCEWAMNINTGPGCSKTMDQNFKKWKKNQETPHTQRPKKPPIKAENWKPQYISKRSVKQMSKQSNVRQKCLQKYHLVVLCWLYTAGYGVYPYV